MLQFPQSTSPNVGTRKLCHEHMFLKLYLYSHSLISMISETSNRNQNSGIDTSSQLTTTAPRTRQVIEPNSTFHPGLAPAHSPLGLFPVPVVVLFPVAELLAVLVDAVPLGLTEADGRITLRWFSLLTLLFSIIHKMYKANYSHRMAVMITPAPSVRLLVLETVTV